MSKETHNNNKKEKKDSALHVNKGINQPDIINTDSIKKFKLKRKPKLSVHDYVNGILKGNITVLSQAITLLESALPDNYELAQEIITKCLPYSEKSMRIGITGVPGAGKSTFIEAIGNSIIADNKKLAVLAIDPSSEKSGGSILGDKTRMEKLSGSPNAFIRPSPTGGSLGGVARKTRESIILCEAAGFDTIFIETVGVGQSETAVHSMVDFFLLLMLAGAGDELQGIKRGIMEMADAIVITKADGYNTEKAKSAKVEYQNALHLFPPTESGWIPKVLTCSALENKGLDKIQELFSEYFDFVKKTNYLQTKRNMQAKRWMYETINENLLNSFYNNNDIKKLIKDTEMKVISGETTSFLAAQYLLDRFLKKT